MVRERGTLINFKGDGAITQKGIVWAIHSGKVAAGQERTLIVDREQLRTWGILQGA
ncbi:MAG: hypothetical protein WBN94_10700 [Methanothrix sp.]|jgi:hypothetical protein